MIGFDMLGSKKCHVKRRGKSLRGQTSQSAQAWMLESRAERSAFGASLRGARHSSSRRWFEFSESKNVTAESHEQTNK